MYKVGFMIYLNGKKDIKGEIRVIKKKDDSLCERGRERSMTITVSRVSIGDEDKTTCANKSFCIRRARARIGGD